MKSPGIVVAALCLAAAPLGTLLPEEFHSRFHHGVADRMYLTPAGSADVAWVDLTFRNTSTKEVKLRWLYKAAGALVDESQTIETVGFSPTAVCHRSGHGFKIYVAGWAERTSTCIVEEWEFETPIAIGSMASMGGGDPVSVLDVPTITKTQIFSSTTSGPIHDIACNVYGDTLWMLEGDGPRRILSLDIDSSTVTEAYSSATLPQLADDASLNTGRNLDAGFMVWSQPKRSWQSMAEFEEPYAMLVFVDSDMNGIIDVVDEVSAGQFVSDYASHGWDLQYAEPGP